MRIYSHETITVAENEIPADSFVEIPDDLLPTLRGVVSYIHNGELRVPRNVESLAALIVGLTTDDLPLQRQLLMRHCIEYEERSLPNRWKEWERLVEIKITEGTEQQEAEQAAAEELYLLAFMAERP